MNNIYNLESILNAVEDINSGPKKKIVSFDSNNFDKPKKKNPTTEEVLPITEKLILEAEEHSHRLKKNTYVTEQAEPIKEKPILINKEQLRKPEINSLDSLNKIEDVLILDKEDILILDKEYNDQKLETINLEEIKNIVIDDLYSSLSKKVKKNTLKIIFDLHKQINDLEKKIEVLKTNKIHIDYTQVNGSSNLNENNEHLINEDKLELNEEHLISEDNVELNEEHLINENNFETNKEHLNSETENSLSEDTIKTLRQQNSLIKKFENNEEKLRLKIVDLEQNITLLGNKTINFDHNISLNRKENELSGSISKTKSESIFYRDNYERLIIENNDIKKKLVNAKKQIFDFEKNIKELENAFENLSNIFSKNSIIKLNEPPKDSSTFVSSEENSQKSKLTSIQRVDKNKK